MTGSPQTSDSSATADGTWTADAEAAPGSAERILVLPYAKRIAVESYLQSRVLVNADRSTVALP